jgi:MYXO-CTERM domain-containing protein
LEIVHNTILAPQNSAIRSDGIVGTVLIANNAVYAQNGSAIRVQGTLGGLVVSGNVGLGGTQGVNMGYKDGSGIASDFVAASFSNNVPNNVFPASASALVNAGDATHVVSDDFNGTQRQGIADVGAYKFDAAGNPGWVLTTDFKDLPMGSSSSSSSSSGSGASSSSSGNPGSGGSGGGSASSSSSSGNVETGGAGGTGGSNSGDEGSCACRTGASSSNTIASQAWLFALGGLAIAVRGRRRNQTSAGRAERFRQ